MNKKQTGLYWIFSRRMLILLAFGSLVTALLVGVFTSSLFIRPLYQAEALIYVPLTVLTKQIEQQGIGFASDVEIDGHIQILQSARLRDSLIVAFSLDRVLNIDLEKIGGKSKLYDLLSRRINTKKTRYNSVSISVRDEDPVRAAEMANEVVRLGDVIKGDILYANRKEVYLHAKAHYETKENSVLALENLLDSLGKIAPSVNDAQRLGNEIFKLQTLYSIELQELAGRKNHLETIQRGYETALPTAYIISEALPEAKPVWPKRMLWTGFAVMAYIIIVIFTTAIVRDVT